MRWPALLLLGTLACGSARPAGMVAPVPKTLRVDVEIGGRAAAPIDARILDATPPDFASDGHRAWRLATLLGVVASRDDAVVEATGEGGYTAVFRKPKTGATEVPVLAITRRGEVAVALVRPDEPFPAYHGQGGARERPGDPLPRLQQVSKLRVTFAAAEGRPSSSEPAIEVRVVGGAAAFWSVSALDRVPRLQAAAVGADRDAWSLRDLAHVLVGPGSRIVAVIGDGQRKAISAEEWQDASRQPLVRIGSGGRKFKFRWIERDGKLGEAELKDVQAVEAERR